MRMFNCYLLLVGIWLGCSCLRSEQNKLCRKGACFMIVARATFNCVPGDVDTSAARVTRESVCMRSCPTVARHSCNLKKGCQALYGNLQGGLGLAGSTRPVQVSKNMSGSKYINSTGSTFCSRRKV